MKNIFDVENDDEEKALYDSINLAHEIQIERFRECESTALSRNSDMQIPAIRKYCRLDDECAGFLKKAIKTMYLSNRAYLRLIKVAKTIADMEGQAEINLGHLAEAVQYRKIS